MPINDPLLRATLKRISLALLAGLACTAPAMAQTLNTADTLAYINERCEGHTRSHGGGVNSTGRVTAAGERLTLRDSMDIYSNSSGVRHDVSSLDLRRVDISAHNTNSETAHITFSCGAGRCVSLTQNSPDHRAGRVDTTGQTTGTQIYCRDADRVANAFRHLQQLVGGRIADPVDPFAN